jgi:hypothetical protein
MTPQQHAQEIYNSFYAICAEYTEEIQCSLQAKQCAMWHVREKLKTASYQKLKFAGEGLSERGFYEQVQKHLEEM